MDAAIDYGRLDEPALVALAKAGHRLAFQAIMQRCNQRLFRTARAVMRDDVEAEDVVQDSYLKAFAHLDSFRGDARLLTWLTQITLNEARGRLRRRRPATDLEGLDVAQGRGEVIGFSSGSTQADPEATAARNEARRLLERAVDELPDAFRLVFILREIEECTVEETAAQTGLKPETVKTRLHRARRLLRRALQEELSTILNGAFPFLGARCDRIAQRVLEQLARPA
jgi:RNA polymerase sigma-70 factor (ECF subfamily)